MNPQLRKVPTKLCVSSTASAQGRETQRGCSTLIQDTTAMILGTDALLGIPEHTGTQAGGRLRFRNPQRPFVCFLRPPAARFDFVFRLLRAFRLACPAASRVLETPPWRKKLGNADSPFTTHSFPNGRAAADPGSWFPRFSSIAINPYIVLLHTT
jgi:hypothetical protein